MFEKLFEFIQQFAELFKFWEVVHPYEGGLVLRLGVYHRDLKPGFNWLIPFGVDHTITEYTVKRTSRVHSMSTDTKDGTTIGFEAVIKWKIKGSAQVAARIQLTQGRHRGLLHGRDRNGAERVDLRRDPARQARGGANGRVQERGMGLGG